MFSGAVLNYLRILLSALTIIPDTSVTSVYKNTHIKNVSLKIRNRAIMAMIKTSAGEINIFLKIIYPTIPIRTESTGNKIKIIKKTFIGSSLPYRFVIPCLFFYL
jgi:hypothetical protein